MEAPICALGGAIFKLPVKLDGLLHHGLMLPKGAEKEIPLIKRDLEEIIAIFHGHISRFGVPPLTVNCWMKEVRELSYDIEDCIDQYDHTANSKSNNVCKISHRKFTKRKNNRLHEKLKHRLWIASKIREFSVRVQEALQRHQMYNLGGINDATTADTPTYEVSFQCLPPPHYGVPTNLVGIDCPINKLEEWLIKDGEKKLKIVALLGSGGIGKTTLANELYCKIGGHFDCRAFVRASQKPDMRRLLNNMLSQVQPRRPSHTWKVDNQITEIRKHLQDKRYMIVVDGVWATSTWEIVNCVLTDDNRCSRVLITTEIEDVAHKCCGYDSKFVFIMKPLSEDDSRRLFFSRVFGSEHECPSELNEVADNIIRKSGGFPLAIVTLSSILASQMGKSEQWHSVDRSVGYGLRSSTTYVEGMKKVLNLSYTNLPHHLKACMLYLNIYEEDYIIWKDDLVQQWIAEGCICATGEQDREEIAERYFDDLVSRRMIQPLHINDNNEVLSCTVYHMVLNLISYESIQENFAISIDHSQTTTRLADKVRRLSLQYGNAEDARPPTNMRLSQVRSLAYFGVFKCMPCISGFQLLQVLILHFWGDESIRIDVTKISGLFRLRYLQVKCNVTLELQNQMRGMQCLQSLKIDARASVVPSDIVHLPRLLHLNLPAQTDLHNGIGHMTSLRTLGCFDLSSTSIENVQRLGELIHLRGLQLACHTVQPDNLKNNLQCLGSILGKLRNLNSLTLVRSSPYFSTLDIGNSTRMSISGDGLSSVSPPVLLQRLELLPRVCIFSNLPKWIGQLGRICILKIGVRKLAGSDVDVLGGLPALAVLSLYIHIEPIERIVFDRAGFLVLKYFKFRCSVPLIKFEADSMPNLRKLKLGFNARSTTIPVGIDHLSGLKKMCAKIGGAAAEEIYARAVQFCFREVMSMHPGRPNVNIRCVDRVFGGKDDMGSRTQEEGGGITLQARHEIMEEDKADYKSRSQEEGGLTLQEHEMMEEDEQALVLFPLSPQKSEIQINKMPRLIKEEFATASERCHDKQPEEASRLQAVNRKLTAMNKLLLEENDRFQRHVGQLVHEKAVMAQQLLLQNPALANDTSCESNVTIHLNSRRDASNSSG